MKRLVAVMIIAGSLAAAGCPTVVAVRPPHPGLILVEGRWVAAPGPRAVWIEPHWERRAFHRVWVSGYWAY